jgi:hypothetical protein
MLHAWRRNDLRSINFRLFELKPRLRFGSVTKRVPLVVAVCDWRQVSRVHAIRICLRWLAGFLNP